MNPAPKNHINTVPKNQPVPVPEPIQHEEDLSSLLDKQLAGIARRKRQANRVIFAFVGLVAASASVWYVSSEKNRRIVADLIMDFKSSGKDFEMIAGASGMADQYDKALQEIGTRSTDIDAATKSLGVDPSTVAEDGMEADMKELMGGEGVTAGERNNMLQNSLADRMAKANVQKEQNEPSAKSAPRAPAAPVVADNPALRPNPAAARRPLPTAPAATSSASAARPTVRVAPTSPKEAPAPDDVPLVIP